jgi:ATP-dependent DNA ligase
MSGTELRRLHGAASHSENAARHVTAANKPVRISARAFARYLGPPKLICEVRYLTWTADGLVRQGAYKGLRADKPARDVRRRRPA